MTSCALIRSSISRSVPLREATSDSSEAIVKERAGTRSCASSYNGSAVFKRATCPGIIDSVNQGIQLVEAQQVFDEFRQGRVTFTRLLPLIQFKEPAHS